MDELLTYKPLQALRPHINFLTSVGYWNMVMKSDAHDHAPAKKIYIFIIWFLTFLFNMQLIVKTIQSRHSTDLMVDTLFIELTHFNSLFKHVIYSVRNQRLRRLINALEGPLFTPKNPEHVKIIKQNERSLYKLQAFYVRWVVASAIMLFGVAPMVNKALGYQVPLYAYFPFDTNSNIGFGCAVFYITIVIVFLAYATVIMDLIVAAFYTQAGNLILILQYNLKNLVDLDVEITGTDIESNNLGELKGFFKDSPVIKRRFAFCVQMYQLVLWFVDETESIFSESLSIQFLVLAWVLCMTVYKASGVNILSAEFATIISYLVCMLTELFVYCYYGTQLNFQSKFIGQSIYFCDWVHLSPSFRKHLLILTQCTMKPFLPCAAKIVPISLETFISVLRSSYTLFTILNTNGAIEDHEIGAAVCE